MRLLNTATYALETFMGVDKPPYAILSHTWGEDEVLFEDIQDALHNQSADKFEQKWRRKSGAQKILDSAKKASKHGYKYIWIDTCCIDKRSSAELSEAINSMYRWYQKSGICYAYLSDVDFPVDTVEGNGTFGESRWFHRGWTGVGILMYRQLQELIAPRKVIFYTPKWERIGTRRSLATTINAITRINMSLLQGSLKHSSLESFSIHTRMTWAHKRETTRPEDRAYSMMGIFDVNMPLLYGEGGVKAFARLQEEIIKGSNDQSILLHTGRFRVTANSPDDFSPTLAFQPSPKTPIYTIERANSELRISLLIYKDLRGFTLGILEIIFADDPSRLCRPALELLAAHGKDKCYHTGGDLFKVRPNTNNQVEVTNLNDSNEIVAILDQHRLERRVIEIIGFDAFEPIFDQQFKMRAQDLWLRPIVHTTAPKLFKYAACYHGIDEPLIYRGNFMKVFEDFYIVAAITLHHLRQEDSSVVVLIFAQLLPESANVEWVYALKARVRYIFPYLVNLRSWLGESSGDFDPVNLESVLECLPKLPIIRADQPATLGEVRTAILEDAPKQDSSCRFLLPTSDAVRIAVSLNWTTILEEEILNFEAEITEEKRDELEEEL